MKDNQLDHHLSQKGVITNTFWVYLVTLLIAPMQYIIRILIAQHLPLEQVGIFYSLMGLTGILAIYNDLWFREAIGYFYPQYLAQKDYNKSKTILIITLILQIISSLIFACVLYRTSDRIAVYYLKDSSGSFAIQVFGAYLLFYIIYNFIDGIFMIFQDGFWNKIIGLISYILIVSCIFFTPLWLFTFLGVRSNLTGFILSNIFPSIICIGIGVIIFLKKYYTSIARWSFQRDRSEYKKIQWYAFGVLITNNIIYLIAQIDLQFTTFLFGPKEAALYSYGMMITNLTISLLAPIGGLLYPMISHFKARDEHHKFGMVMYGVMNYLWVIALVSSFFLWTYSNHITSFLFGSEYRHAWSIIKRNLLFVIFGFLWWILYVVYAWFGMIKSRMKMLIAVLIVNILLNILLSRILWVEGIALTMGLTWLMMFSYSYRDLKKQRMPITLDRSFIARNAVLSIIILWGLSYFYPFDLPDKYSVGMHLLYSGLIYMWGIMIWNITRLKSIRWFIKQMIT